MSSFGQQRGRSGEQSSDELQQGDAHVRSQREQNCESALAVIGVCRTLVGHHVTTTAHIGTPPVFALHGSRCPSW